MQPVSELPKCDRCIYGTVVLGEVYCECCLNLFEQEEKESKETQLYKDVEDLKYQYLILQKHLNELTINVTNLVKVLNEKS